MPDQQPSKAQLRRTLFFSSLAVVLLCAFGLSLVKLYLDGQAQSALRLSEQIVSRLQAEKLRQLATQAKDYAYWDASVAAIQKRDTEWAEENFGSYLLDTFSIDMSLVSDREGRVFFQASAKDGLPQPQVLLRHPVVQQLLSQTFAQSSDEPIPTDGILTLDGQMMMVAVAAILPDTDSMPDYKRDHSLLLLRLLDADYLAGIQHLLFLDHLAVSAQAMEGHGNLPLVSPLGDVLGYLHWQPRQTGNVLGPVAMIFGLFMLAIILIAVGLLWQLYRLARKYEQNAVIDALTGLYNRRYFNSIAEQEMRRLCRGDYLVGFLLVDVDNFKKYNDQYGHQAGDDALQRIGHEMNETFKRASDHACRLGGEEFGIIFIGSDEQHIRDQAEQLRAHIEALAIEHRGNTPHCVITVSIGCIIAHPEQQQCNIEKAYSLADKALYKAKAEGRNAVRLASITPAN